MTGDSTGRDLLPVVLTDDRARVPFVIVAVLLLVSAVALVGHLESRESAETDTDPALAVDRTETAIQTAVRDGTASAAQQAAAEPLTSLADTNYSDALDADRPFLSYLEALVYLETSERVQAAGQQVDSVQTTVTLPEVTDVATLEQALARINVSETEPGVLTVEIEGVQITATRDGKRVARQTETVELSVPTPVVQQHERTQEFQSRLEAGVTTPGSFSQQFNARVYALGWMRGYAQYGGLPVTEVIANRHVEPSVNSALYRTQQDVFGAADPRLDRAVGRGWFCMAAQDAEALYGGYSVANPDVADDICTASEWILGEKHTGTLPDGSDITGQIGEAAGMNQEETVDVGETAYAPLRTLVAGSGRQSIERATERALTVETGIDARVDSTGLEFDHERPSPGANVTERKRLHQDIAVRGGTVTAGEPAENGTYYRFSNVTAAVKITEKQVWEWTVNGSTKTETTSDTAVLDVELTLRLVENETAPDLYVNAVNGDLGVEHKYEPGPNATENSRTVPVGFRNYAGAADRVAEAVVGGTDRSAFETWLEGLWADVTRETDLALPETEEAVLDIDAQQEALLVSTAVDDVSTLQESVENVSHTFERTELIRGEDETGPLGELASKLREKRETYLDREEAYKSVGQQAVYEIRYAYFETLLEQLERLDSAHGSVMGTLDTQLRDIDSSLDDALTFLQEGVDPEDDDSGSDPAFDSPEITPEITYEVSGSPTYLAGEPVSSAEVPAVDQSEEFSPLAAKTNNYLKLPYQTIVSGILNTVLDYLGIGERDVELTLHTAGEALRAGELAEIAAEPDGYADSVVLGTLTAALEGSVDDALDEFVREMGIEVVREVYDVQPDLVPPGYSNETHSAAAAATANAAETTVEGYDTTAQAAIAVGGGNATESLVTAVVEALDDEEIERPSYASGLSDDGWQELVASAVRPALDRAAANATATVESTAPVEALDTVTRQALENVSADILEDRLESHLNGDAFNLGEYERWVGNGSEIDTPVRVPAGLPLLPLPTMWVATMNLWNIDASGEYARFEVEANMSAPGRETSTTYVRENTTVERVIAGESRTLGAVEPVGFDGRSVLVVVVPPGGIGVGDRDDENPECTETYPVVGAYDEEQTAC